MKTGMVFSYNGHGEFSLSNEKTIIKNNNFELLTVGEKIIASHTEDNEYHKIYNADKYLVLTSNNKYLLSDKIDIDTRNFNNNTLTLEQYNISDYLKNDIIKVIEEQNELDNTSFKIELFAPALTPLEENASIMAIEPLGTQYYTYYYRGKKNNMKDYSVRYSYLSSGMIRKSGSSTLCTEND